MLDKYESISSYYLHISVKISLIPNILRDMKCFRYDIQAKNADKEVDMSISSIGMSYSALQQTSSLTIKGQENTTNEEKSASSVNSKGDMDTVSLSEEASQEYTIGSKTVSKSEFDQYDTDGDGDISASEQAAYEADQTDAASEENSDPALVASLESDQKEEEEESVAMYSPYGSMSIIGESGASVNATA